MTTLETAIRAFGVQPIASGPTMVLKSGRADLCRLFAECGFTRGAEIGVWKGVFSQAICEVVPGVHLNCVDPWESLEDYHEKKNDAERLSAAFIEARDRLRPFDCTLLRMTSTAAAEMVPQQSLDFVYIDGNHTRAHVLSDLEIWSRRVRLGGIVAGHDFQTSRQRPWIEVEAAVRSFTKAHAIEPWFVLAGDKSPSYFWVMP